MGQLHRSPFLVDSAAACPALLGGYHRLPEEGLELAAVETVDPLLDHLRPRRAGSTWGQS